MKDERRRAWLWIAANATAISGAVAGRRASMRGWVWVVVVAALFGAGCARCAEDQEEDREGVSEGGVAPTAHPVPAQPQDGPHLDASEAAALPIAAGVPFVWLIWERLPVGPEGVEAWETRRYGSPEAGDWRLIDRRAGVYHWAAGRLWSFEPMEGPRVAMSDCGCLRAHASWRESPEEAAEILARCQQSGAIALWGWRSLPVREGGAQSPSRSLVAPLADIDRLGQPVAPGATRDVESFPLSAVGDVVVMRHCTVVTDCLGAGSERRCWTETLRFDTLETLPEALWAPEAWREALSTTHAGFVEERLSERGAVGSAALTLWYPAYVSEQLTAVTQWTMGACETCADGRWSTPSVSWWVRDTPPASWQALPVPPLALVEHWGERVREGRGWSFVPEGAWGDLQARWPR